MADLGHDLKTPVGAMVLLAETMTGESDPEVLRRLAGRVLGEAQRLGRMVQDLLDGQGPEQGRGRQEQVPVREIVLDALAFALPLAEARGVRVDATGIPHEIEAYGSRRQLTRALANLVENAIKYSGAREVVTVSVVADEEWIDLRVRDDGVGIPASDLDRIFERRYRSETGRLLDPTGTGLGLSIVRRIARTHAGDVFVSSREGLGSTFTLRLPRSPATRVVRIDAEAPSAVTRPGAR